MELRKNLNPLKQSQPHLCGEELIGLICLNPSNWRKICQLIGRTRGFWGDLGGEIEVNR
ncbi:MAG: hypothetical protein GXO13_05955 [Epsilonproteobacteria bacterium]|nr:hypothetical protein [Campylobacterota bacterium]